MFVVERYDGWFVADQRLSTTGSSYTDKLQHAKRYSSQEEAQRDRCGNERIVRYEDAGR